MFKQINKNLRLVQIESTHIKNVSGRVQNIVGKIENAGYQHFLLFPQCFQRPLLQGCKSTDRCGKGITRKPQALRILGEKPIKNIVEKGENAGNPPFLLLSRFLSFQRPIPSSKFCATIILSSASVYYLDQSIFLFCGEDLIFN